MGKERKKRPAGHCITRPRGADGAVPQGAGAVRTALKPIFLVLSQKKVPHQESYHSMQADDSKGVFPGNGFQNPPKPHYSGFLRDGHW